MATNITVKTRIRVNGQEYASTDDMPPAIRQAYERAMAELKGGTPRDFSPLPASGISQVLSKITFHGQDFPSVDAMPPEIRKLYDGVMAEFDAERSAGANAGGGKAGQNLCRVTKLGAGCGSAADLFQRPGAWPERREPLQ